MRKSKMVVMFVIAFAMVFSVTASAFAETVTLRVLSTTIVESPEGDVERRIAEEFMRQNPNIKVEFIGTPMNMVTTRLTTMALSQEVPDIFVCTPDLVAQVADLDVTLDLYTVFSPEYVAGFNVRSIEKCSHGGKLIMVPWFDLAFGVIYRSDWLDELGLEPPSTWGEFAKIAKAMTRDNAYGFGLMGSRDRSAALRILPVLWTYGVKELAIDDKGEYYTELDSPGAIEAFTMLHSLYKNGYTPPGVLETSYGEAVALMAQERIGMLISASHTYGAVLERNPALDGKISGFAIPTGTVQSTRLSSHGYAISKDSPHVEEAVKYIQFLYSTKNLVEWNTVTGRLPARPEAANSPEFDTERYGLFMEAAEHGEFEVSSPFYGDVLLIIADALQQVLVGNRTPEKALQVAAAEVRTLIEQAR